MKTIAIFTLCFIALAASTTHPGVRIVNDDAIILLDETEFIIFGQDKAVLKRHLRVQVNNLAGKKYGELYVNESKYTKTGKISGKILSTDGKELYKLAKEDIHKISYSDVSLYSDSKYAWAQLTLNRFPYVVDYCYEQEFKSLFFWPDWTPQQTVPVIKAIYRLTIPPDIQYRSYTVGIVPEPRLSRDNGKKVLVWKLDSLAAEIDEKYMPAESDPQTAVLFAPVEFKIENYLGSCASWKTLGSWYNDLSQERHALPSEARIQVRQLIDAGDSEIRKVQKLYHFLQSYTRYVSISLGISGWQPCFAAEVYVNRYGDCKDLSNFMISILAEIGIQAYPVLISTRSNGTLIREFPDNNMNHVIVFVPLASDTLWLECTSDLLAAGELSYEIEDCDALVIKTDGGEMVHTPASNSCHNAWSSRIEGILVPAGNLNFTGQIVATGEKACHLREELRYLKPEEQKRWLVGRLSTFLPKLDLSQYEFTHLDNDLELPMQVKFAGTVARFANMSSNRLFMNANFLHRMTAEEIPRETQRQFPIEYNYAFLDADTLVVTLPGDYQLESAPELLRLDSTFASFTTDYAFSQGKLSYHRVLSWRQRQVPAIYYSAYLTFMQTLLKNDKSQFVFRK